MSRTRLAVGILWIVFSILPALLIGLTLGVMCLLLLFIALLFTLLVSSPFVSMLCVLALKLAEILVHQTNKYVRYCLSMLFNILQFLMAMFFVLAISISIEFLVGIFGFTIMGLVLSAEIVTPYVAFMVVVTTNIYLCHANLQTSTRKSRDLFCNSGNKNHRQNAAIGTQFHQICFGL